MSDASDGDPDRDESAATRNRVVAGQDVDDGPDADAARDDEADAKAEAELEAEEPAPLTRRRRRGRGQLIGFCVALALLLTGVSLLAYVGWQYWGTDYVAKKKQAEIRTELRDRWEHPTVGDVLGPEAAAPRQGSAEALVRIPRFGTSYEVPLIEGVRDSDLEKGIGHFPGTGPGQVGNFALAAHRITHGEPFRDMPDLRPGDEVIIETSDATYTYVLDTNPNDLVVPFTESWVIDQVPVPPEGEAPPGMPTFDSSRPKKALITLTTCSELFHTDNRLVAFGHLVSTTPKSP
jgi:sortase A